jgi:hypothetical protein
VPSARRPSRASSDTAIDVLTRDRRAHAPALDDDGRVGREIDLGRCDVEALDGQGGAQVDRVEPEARHLDGDRCACGHRPGDRPPVVPARGDITRFDADLLGGPRSGLRQGAILEGDRSSMQREVVHGHVKGTTVRFRSLDEIRKVEEACWKPHNADCGVRQDEIAQPEMPQHERGKTQTEVKPPEVGERRAPVALCETEPVNRAAAGEEIEIDTLDADRALRERMDPRDGDAASELGQDIRRRSDADQDHTDD